jgi:hypothetical protein
VFRGPYQKAIEDFLKGEGANRIFIYYQTQYKILESSEIQDIGGHEEFFVTDGEKIKLKGKGVYFVRTTPPKKAINLMNGNDNDILFGEISQHTVTSLDTIINKVYKPLVDRLDTQSWGVCEDEQKKEFNSVFDKFAVELREALKSLTTNITLQPYPAQW